MKQWVEVQDQSAIAVVRRAARSLATRHDWPKLRIDELAIVATEATTNILRYAEQGRVLINAPAEGKGDEIVMIFTDRGPGISDMDQMFQDGMSSGDSAGLGLGAIRRLSNGFDIFSGPEVGTTIVCSFAKEAPRPTYGVEAVGLRVCHPNEDECGDDYLLRQTPKATDILLCDGLGHGTDAAAASLEVTEAVLRSRSFNSEPGAVMHEVTEQLIGKRGAVGALVHIAQPQMVLRYAALGNIATLRVRDGDIKRLPVRDGRIGARATRGYEETFDLEPGDLLILHSDGLKTLRDGYLPQGLLWKSPLLIAGYLLDRAFRGRDDASIVVIRIARSAD